MWWVMGYLVVGWLLIEWCNAVSVRATDPPMDLGMVMWILLGWPLVLPAAIIDVIKGS